MKVQGICRLLAAVSIVVGSALSTWAAGTVTTLLDSGPSSNRIDIVFLGDGYQIDELDEYGDTVDKTVQHFFFEGEEPFGRYRDYFNVHRIDVVSNQSGADFPKDGVRVDTALNASYQFDGQTDQLLYIDEAKANAVLSASLANTTIEPDLRLVAVNHHLPGGGGGNYATFAGGALTGPDIGLHEAAHTFSGLADEYVVNQSAFPGSEPTEANVTTNPDGSKWAAWLGYEQEGLGVIGAYEGGLYFSEGIFRPSANSKMRTIGQPFDAVSREEIVLDIYRQINPLDDWRDDSGLVTDGQPLWVTPIHDELIEVKWSVNGATLDGFTGNQLDLRDVRLEPGTYFIGATAFDPTDWVRRDFLDLQQQVFWVVSHYPGDLDSNRSVDADDIDLLVDAIVAGDGQTQFDINGDGSVSGMDLDRWLYDAGSVYGDVNLDGEVSFIDFVALSTHFGATDASWAQGNFNLDDEVNFSDFVLLANHFGVRRTDVWATIPEPATGLLLVVALLVSGAGRRSRRQSA